jgi:hypothetical protein
VQRKRIVRFQWALRTRSARSDNSWIGAEYPWAGDTKDDHMRFGLFGGAAVLRGDPVDVSARRLAKESLINPADMAHWLH